MCEYCGVVLDEAAGLFFDAGSVIGAFVGNFYAKQVRGPRTDVAIIASLRTVISSPQPGTLLSLTISLLISIALQIIQLCCPLITPN